MWPTVAFVFTIQFPLLVLPTWGLLYSCAEILSWWVHTGPAQVDPSVEEVTKRDSSCSPCNKRGQRKRGVLTDTGVSICHFLNR